VTNLINFISKNGGKIPKNHNFNVIFFYFLKKAREVAKIRRKKIIASGD
jgi:hypothetical protein